MNIIKLKDKVYEGNDYFNEHLKGKYAWFIRMQYIVPLEDLEMSKYILAEQEGMDAVYGTFYIDIKDDDLGTDIYNNYTDHQATEAINSINLYLTQNAYVTDDDITLEELKLFRRWLAINLLSFDAVDGAQSKIKYDDATTHMLQYYANDMYNDIVKYLMIYGMNTASAFMTPLSTSTCGCSGNTLNTLLYGNNANLNTILYGNLTTGTLSTCDPLAVYRLNIYKKMVDTFSNLEFWINRHNDSHEFMVEFKKYVDNILKVGLNIITNPHEYKLADCPCTSNTTDSNQLILRRLSESLGYIISYDTATHRNFIVDSFKDWATYCYENMFWV